MFEGIELNNSGSQIQIRPPTYKVKGARSNRSSTKPSRTVSKHQNGLSVEELRIIDATLHYMGRYCLIAIVIAPHSETELEARKIIRDVKNRIVLWLRRHEMPGYWLDILEGTVGVHSNLIFPVPSKKIGLKLINSIKSERWKFDPGVVKVMDRNGTRDGFVYDVKGLRGYLLKESTTQAHYAANYSFRRDEGSHKLGEGGGDRVHMSKELEDNLVGSGRIAPRKRTYAKRTLGKPKPQATAKKTSAKRSPQKPQSVIAAPPFLAGLLWQTPTVVPPIFGTVDTSCRHQLRVPVFASTLQPYRKDYPHARAS